MKIKVYDNNGQEQWLQAGELVPAGWYNSDCEVLIKPHWVVRLDEHGEILILEEA